MWFLLQEVSHFSPSASCVDLLIQTFLQQSRSPPSPFPVTAHMHQRAHLSPVFFFLSSSSCSSSISHRSSQTSHLFLHMLCTVFTCTHIEPYVSISRGVMFTHNRIIAAKGNQSSLIYLIYFCLFPLSLLVLLRRLYLRFCLLISFVAQAWHILSGHPPTPSTPQPHFQLFIFFPQLDFFLAYLAHVSCNMCHYLQSLFFKNDSSYALRFSSQMSESSWNPQLIRVIRSSWQPSLASAPYIFESSTSEF